MNVIEDNYIEHITSKRFALADDHELEDINEGNVFESDDYCDGTYDDNYQESVGSASSRISPFDTTKNGHFRKNKILDKLQQFE